MHRLVPILAILALSCGNTARPDFLVHLVDASNGNPFNQCNSGTVRVDVQQSTNAVLTSNANITGTGTISSLAVEIPSYGLTTQIEVTVQCMHPTRGPITLIGATPHFIPVGFGFVNIVLGEPEQCQTLASPTLVAPRIAPHFITLHANVIALGGVELGGTPSTRVQAIDPVTLTYPVAGVEFDRLSVGIGRGSAVGLGDTRIVFASDSLTGIFDAGPDVMTRLTRPDSLYPGAAGESAVVSLNGNGVAIVGGAFGGNAVDSITWISADGGTSSLGHLLHARRRPAATLIQGSTRLLVVGGQAAGEPLFELVTLMGDGSVAFDPPTSEQRFGAIVTSDLSHAHAFVALGTDAPDGGTLSTTSWVLSNCTASGCDVAAGPVLTDPRSEVALVEHHVGVVGAPSPTDDFETLLIGGVDASGAHSPLIDRVHFQGGTVTLTPAGMLTAPRRSVGATDIGGGIVLVGGGQDDHDNGLATLEICFPAQLRPIGPAE